MIEVHLIGYTADLRHLVLDLDDGADGRYRLLVDADLFATVDELRDERRDAGLPVGDLEEFLSDEELAAIASAEEAGPEADGRVDPGEADTGMWSRDEALFGEEDDDLEDDEPEEELEPEEEPAADEPEPEPEEEPVRISAQVRLVSPSPFAPERGDARPAPEPRPDPEPRAAPEPAPAPEPRAQPEPEPEREPEPARAPEPEPEPEPEPAVEPKLSPAQIQSLLRSGRSPRVVAREAGTDVAWIERWLPPIMAERTRILDRAQAKRLERPRLGRSRDALGQAVERNLAAKGVPSEELVWEAARRKDGRWKVTVRFLQRDRVRTATWTYDPSDDELKPASELAHELGFSRAKDTGGDAPAEKKTKKKPARTAKKKTAKAPAKERTPATERAPERTPAKKAKKATKTKKAAAQKTPAKKQAPAKKTTAKKQAAKKAPAKKTTPSKKAAAKKQPTAEKATKAKKATAKKQAPAKKGSAPARRSSSR